MQTSLNISSILLVILGTYFLSKKLFVDTILNKFTTAQLSYQKYSDLPLFLKFAGFIYGVKSDNWFNINLHGEDNSIRRKLKDPTAPFRGILYIVFASILQLISNLNN